MKRLLLLLCIIPFYGFTQDTIPQGTFTYQLYYAEWEGRMPNTEVTVIIKGDKITVQKNKNTNLTGPNLILKGTVLKHDSGVWIIATEPEEAHAPEVGGCVGIIPIDFSKQVVEWC